MKIKPDSEIYLCKNVPLRPDYNDVILFDSVESKAQYFINKGFKKLSNYSFVKNHTQQILVDVPIGELYDVNYLFYRNTHFSSRYFYCFITGVEMINPNTSKITFTQDIFTTWQHDIHFGNCWVERETTESDRLYEHILPEDINGGPMIYSRELPITFDELNKDLKIVFFSSEKVGYLGYEPKIRHNQYIPFYTFAVDYDEMGIQNMNQVLDKLATEGKLSAIQNICIMPRALFKAYFDAEVPMYAPWFLDKPFTPPTSLDGYTPRNKKLLSSQYTTVEMNGWGSSIQLQPEYIPKNPVLRITAPIEANSSFIMWVPNYRGLLHSVADSSCLSQPLPTIGYATEDAINSLNMNKWSRLQVQTNAQRNLFVGLGSGAVGSGATGMLGSGRIDDSGNLQPIYQNTSGFGSSSSVASSVLGYSKNLVSSISSYANQMQSMRAEEWDIKDRPSNIQNLTATPLVNFLLGWVSPFAMTKCIQREQAIRLDKFFDMYGYRVNERKVPTMKNRPSWDYIKCGDVKLYGSLNQSDLQELENIFIKGVTVWHKNGSGFGDYSQSNTPVSTVSTMSVDDDIYNQGVFRIAEKEDDLL